MGLFGKLRNAGGCVNFKRKCQEADLVLRAGFAGARELNAWAVSSVGEFLSRHLGTPLASLF